VASWYVAPTLDVLLAEINKTAPGRSKVSDGSIGDAAHSSRASDHNPDPKGCVHARDFTHDPAGGFDSYRFADWIRAQVNSGAMHIRYVISNGRIFNPRISPAWRTYTGSNPHDHHVHVSVGYDSRENDPSPWKWADAGAGQPEQEDDDLPYSEQQLRAIVGDAINSVFTTAGSGARTGSAEAAAAGMNTVLAHKPGGTDARKGVRECAELGARDALASELADILNRLDAIAGKLAAKH
jgi:hypothetical protein